MPLAALDGLIDTVEWDLEMSASAHAVYMDALRLSAPVLLQNLTVKQTDALATSRILRRTQEVEVSFPSFFHGLPPDETEYEVPLAVREPTLPLVTGMRRLRGAQGVCTNNCRVWVVDCGTPSPPEGCCVCLRLGSCNASVAEFGSPHEHWYTPHSLLRPQHRPER